MTKTSGLFKRSGIKEPIPEKAGEIDNIDFIIDNLPFMIAYVSKEMKYIHVNENYAKMYKKKKSEIIGKDVKYLLPGKTFKIAEGYIKRVLNGEFLEYENVFPTDEGDQKIVKVKYIPRYDKKGEVDSFLAVIEDITDIKIMENRMDERERKFQILFDEAADSINLVDTEAFNIVEFNKSAYKNYGYTKEEYSQFRIMDIDVGLPEAEARSNIERVLKEGYLVFESKHRTKTGEPKDVRISSKKIEIDNKIYILNFYRDITNEKKYLNKITQIGDILEDSLNEIYIFDFVTLKFENMNRGGRENLGYSMDELKEMTPLDIKKELTHQEFDNIVAPLIKGEKKIIEFNAKHFRKDGTYYDVEIHLQLSSVEGKRTFTAIIIDISERVETEKELLIYRKELELLVKERTMELEKINKDLIEKNSDLERFYTATIERELRMKDLSDQMEELRKENEQLKKVQEK